MCAQRTKNYRGSQVFPTKPGSNCMLTLKYGLIKSERDISQKKEEHIKL